MKKSELKRLIKECLVEESESYAPSDASEREAASLRSGASVGGRTPIKSFKREMATYVFTKEVKANISDSRVLVSGETANSVTLKSKGFKDIAEIEDYLRNNSNWIKNGNYSIEYIDNSQIKITKNEDSVEESIKRKVMKKSELKSLIKKMLVEESQMLKDMGNSHDMVGDFIKLAKSKGWTDSYMTKTLSKTSADGLLAYEIRYKDLNVERHWGPVTKVGIGEEDSAEASHNLFEDMYRKTDYRLFDSMPELKSDRTNKDGKIYNWEAVLDTDLIEKMYALVNGEDKLEKTRVYYKQEQPRRESRRKYYS
jgi:hypothetical protein